MNRVEHNRIKKLQITSKLYTIGSVISKDNTIVSYRQLGHGPAIIIMHGAMQSSQNFMKLATLLSNEFTVYIPDRRGRGLSGSPGENYSIMKECEDIEALLIKTGAHNMFGLSSGAIISLYAALNLSEVYKVALYEPPIAFDKLGLNQMFMPRYERQIDEEKLASAFITVLKGLHLSALVNILPRFILVPFFSRIINNQNKDAKDGKVLLKELIPTFHFDNILVYETRGTIESFKNTFKNIQAELLLLNGSKSPSFLRVALKKLSTVLPNSRCIEFHGLHHSGPANSGNPELVAPELRIFFGESNHI